MKKVQFRIIFLGLVHGMIEGCVRMFGKIRAEENVNIF
jgi:hypothetical protein